MVSHFAAPVRNPHNGLQNGEMESLMYMPAARPHRLPSDRVEGELGDAVTTGQQFTSELGKILSN